MKRQFLAFITISILALFAVTTANAEKKELNYRLKWLFNSSVAGDIYADVHGYFARAGLKVNVKEGSPEKNAIKELELGQANFGVASADQVIRALDKGAKIVVLAQIFQINPMQWIYRADRPEITALPDLKGRAIGITFGGNDETIMNTLLTKGGMSQKDVQITGARFDFTPFLTGKVEIWPVYRNSQGVILQDRLGRENEAVRFFNPADFGVNFVANSVVTSERMLEEHPQTVAKFRKALIEGWKAAMDPANEEASLAAIASLDKGNNSDIRKLQLTATRALVVPESIADIGKIDTAAWKQTEEIMLKQKQIKKRVNVESTLWK
ncbi:MAG: nitrate ABC transporter substrate-binding protein [Desulfovibrionaceae bacterium]|nr:nitrate ABC transporter substrate-binding protein [Desulfovibrionaceae bacterium]